MTDTKPKPRHWLAWVNQPSTLQPRHDLHGKRCVVYDTGEKTLRVFFTEGYLFSTEIDRSCLSPVVPTRWTVQGAPHTLPDGSVVRTTQGEPP